MVVTAATVLLRPPWLHQLPAALAAAVATRAGKAAVATLQEVAAVQAAMQVRCQPLLLYTVHCMAHCLQPCLMVAQNPETT